ncbi:cytosine permease [Oceanimonas sp. NS1]|nr:cytosine permease [Oceanimonas sp. NS1]
MSISGVIGLLMMPWLFADNLLWFSVVTSGLLGPVAGIMLADFYLLRRGRIRVEDFYDPKGPFVYQNNYNLRAFLVYGVSFLCSLIFMDMAFFVGLVISVAGYTLLMKPIAKPAELPEAAVES